MSACWQGTIPASTLTSIDLTAPTTTTGTAALPSHPPARVCHPTQVLHQYATAELEVERLEYFSSSEGRDDLYTYNQREGGCSALRGWLGRCWPALGSGGCRAAAGWQTCVCRLGFAHVHPTDQHNTIPCRPHSAGGTAGLQVSAAAAGVAAAGVCKGGGGACSVQAKWGERQPPPPATCVRSALGAVSGATL